MTIHVINTQTCDGCGNKRELDDLRKRNEGGWREVADNKHLDPKCINAALNKLNETASPPAV